MSADLGGYLHGDGFLLVRGAADPSLDFRRHLHSHSLLLLRHFHSLRGLDVLVPLLALAFHLHHRSNSRLLRGSSLLVRVDEWTDQRLLENNCRLYL